MKNKKYLLLKDLIPIIKDGTKVSIYDDMGELCDADEVNKLPLKDLLGAIEREVIEIYYDKSDETLSIELSITLK